MIQEGAVPYLIAIGYRTDMGGKVSPRLVMVVLSIETLTCNYIHHDHIWNPVEPGKL